MVPKVEPKQLAAAKPPPGPKPGPETDHKPKSKSGAAKRGERKAKEIAEIEAGFRELLGLPGLVAGMKGDAWAVDHFARAAPDLAGRIAAECERSDAFRKYCLSAVKAQGFTMLGVATFMYLAPPLMHWGLIPGAEALGVPVMRKQEAPKAQAPPQQEEARPRSPAPEPEPEAATEGYDVDISDYFVEGAINGEVDADDAMQSGGAGIGDEPPVEAV